MAHFYLMHKDLPIAVLDVAETTADVLDIVQVLDEKHFPLGVVPMGDAPDILSFRKWWKGRGIPASRHGLEQALHRLDVPYAEILLLKSNGLSLTDQYWVTPCSSPQRWAEVNFFENPFSDDVGQALFGGVLSDKVDLLSPCCTSEGNLKKRWTIQNGTRVLLKAGTAPFFQEPLNECVASELYQRLGIPHVAYSLVWEQDRPLSVCPCFVTVETEFVSAAAIMRCYPQLKGHNTWQHFLHCCAKLGIPNAQQDVSRMLAADFILANSDRHFGNFGALRNAGSLEWLGMAPIFDSGTSLWQMTQTAFIPKDNYAASMPFALRHHEQMALLRTKDLQGLRWHNLNGFGAASAAILSESPLLDAERVRFISEKVEGRSKMLFQQIERSLQPGIEP